MSDRSETSDPEVFEQTWDLAYRHATGKTVGGFLAGLKTRQLLGRRCGTCERVLFPARSFCDRCHRDTGDWVTVEPRGVVEMFTIVYEDFPGMRVAPPYVLAYALLDGADTAVLGFLKGVDLTDVSHASQAIQTGSPITVRFVDRPEGRVTDFWFELDHSERVYGREPVASRRP